MRDTRRFIAGSEIKQVQSGIVGYGIPNRSATTGFPPLPAPGFGGILHGFGLEALRWITGDRIETPGQLAGLGVVGGDIAANAIFGAGISDDYAAGGDARRAGDGVSLGDIEGVGGPNRRAGALVEGNQFTVERADIDEVAIEGDATIYRIATKKVGTGPLDPRVVGPKLLSGFGVESVNHAPGAGGVENAALDERSGFQAASRAHFAAPNHSQVRHGLFIDLVQRAETLIIVGSPIEKPIARGRVRGGNNIAPGLPPGKGGEAERGKQQQD